jgi:hypothetical protein
MKKIHVIHLSLGDEVVVFVPLKRNFRELLRPERREVQDELVEACKAERLQGHVVPIWINPDNTLEFIAPVHLHDRIQAMSVHRLRANMNRTIPVHGPSEHLLAVVGDVSVLRDQTTKEPSRRWRALVDAGATDPGRARPTGR